MGVVRERNMTKHVMVIYARDGGSMRFEMRPGGAFSAGFKFGSEAGVDMAPPERIHDVRWMLLKEGRKSRVLVRFQRGDQWAEWFVGGIIWVLRKTDAAPRPTTAHDSTWSS